MQSAPWQSRILCTTVLRCTEVSKMCSLLRRKRERGSSQGQSNEGEGACKSCLAIVRVWEKVLKIGLWHAGRLAIRSLRLERLESLALRCMKGAGFKISQSGLAGKLGFGRRSWDSWLLMV